MFTVDYAQSRDTQYIGLLQSFAPIKGVFSISILRETYIRTIPPDYAKSSINGKIIFRFYYAYDVKRFIEIVEQNKISKFESFNGLLNHHTPIYGTLRTQCALPVLKLSSIQTNLKIRGFCTLSEIGGLNRCMKHVYLSVFFVLYASDLRRSLRCYWLSLALFSI